ncbi:MAG: HlyD family efflux transporter periplasmic adaptor subunit [Deltaproteobacteria bacterium]|nr:HlyD family efflux transporter periplasmic adaptor subunit [Deltaproteobacteria bacterium]
MLRKDLEIVPKIGEGGRPHYLIKDPSSKEIFEFGEEEHFFCCQLDGKTRINSIQLAFQDRFGVSIKLDQLEAFTRQLKSLGLLVSAIGESQASGHSVDKVRTYRLCNPDRLLGLLAACFSWCFSAAFLFGSFVVLLLAMGIAVKYASNFFYDMRFILIPSHFFALVPILGLFVVRPLSEVAKGTACKYYGGQVYEFGFYFLYRVIPQFYCDISDAFWVIKKPDRMRVLAAGLVCQILLCAVSIIAWKNTTPGTNIHYFWAAFTFASLVFFIFNLFPLFRRDGYYLLSTRLEKPDLWNRSRGLAKSRILRRPLPEPLTSREILGFKWYGSLSVGLEYILWSLILGFAGHYLTSLMKGIGALMFLAILALRFETIIKKQFRKISVRLPLLANQFGAVKFRWLIWIGVLGATILILLIPYPFEAGGEFRLLPQDQIGIRAQVPGEIESVLVKEGQWIKKGQPVAVLVGRDQRKKVDELEATLRDLRARLQLLQEGPKPEAIEVAKQEVTKATKSLEYSKLQAARSEKMYKNKAISEEDYDAALRMRDLDQERLELAKKNLVLVKSGARNKEVESLEAEVNRLEVSLAHAQEELRLTTLRSPADGRVITPYLSQKVSQHFAVGDLFAVVEDARIMIAEIEIPEEDIEEVKIGAQVTLKTWSNPVDSFKGKVTVIAPVAYEKSIKRIRRALSDRESRFDQREILRDKGKVVRVLCELSDTNPELRTDMTGYAKIKSKWMPVGIAFTRWLVRFFLVEVWSWIP